MSYLAHFCTNAVRRLWLVIKHFKDVLELVIVSKQLLISVFLLELTRWLVFPAHELLYFYGTLHRDISAGTTLICPMVSGH